MKIAFVTDDGNTISAHFGRAAHYLVIEVAEKKEVAREMRDKMGQTRSQKEKGREEHSSEPHGFSPQSQSRHSSMLEVITDCSVVVCGGMGRGAVQSIEASGKDIRLTSVSDINQALVLFLADNLPNHEELSH